MPPDILPDPDDVTPPPPRPDTRPRSIVCDFCGCTLGGDGGVLKTGERAKKLARQEDKSDDKDAEIADLKARLQKAQERTHELEVELQAPDRSAEDDGF